MRIYIIFCTSVTTFTSCKLCTGPVRKYFSNTHETYEDRGKKKGLRFDHIAKKLLCLLCWQPVSAVKMLVYKKLQNLMQSNHHPPSHLQHTFSKNAHMMDMTKQPPQKEVKTLAYCNYSLSNAISCLFLEGEAIHCMDEWEDVLICFKKEVWVGFCKTFHMK